MDLTLSSRREMCFITLTVYMYMYMRNVDLPVMILIKVYHTSMGGE